MISRNCIKSSKSVAVKFEVLLTLEAWDDIKKLLFSPAVFGKAESIRSMYEILWDERNGISETLKQNPEAKQKVVPLLVKWAMDDLRAKATLKDFDDYSYGPSDLCFPSGVTRLPFRENLSISLLCRILEVCAGVSENVDDTGQEIIDVLKLMEECIRRNMEKHSSRHSRDPLQCSEGGNPSYTSKSDTKTGLVGYPGFLPPQVLLTAVRFSKSAKGDGKQAEIMKKVDDLLPFATNQIMAMFRLRHNSSSFEKRGDVDFEVYFSLLVELSFSGEGNFEERVEKVRGA